MDFFCLMAMILSKCKPNTKSWVLALENDNPIYNFELKLYNLIDLVILNN